MSRNYEANTQVRRVSLGEDGRAMLFETIWQTRESEESARQRLLASIAAECPHYQIIEEGKGKIKKYAPHQGRT